MCNRSMLKMGSHGERGTGRLAGAIRRMAVLLCLSAMWVGCAAFRMMPGEPAPTVEEVAAARQEQLEQEARREIARRAPQAEGWYRLKPDDVLEIKVFGAPEWDRTARVGADGKISLPPLGEIKVQGLMERELADFVEEELRRRKLLTKPQVTVVISETHPDIVFLFGAVGSPGGYPLTGGMRLLDLLAEGRGIGAGAGTTAYVIREAEATKHSVKQPDVEGVEENRITIDLEGLLIRGEKEWNIPLWPGDVVNIPVPDPGWVHVTGPGIEQPGTYPLITYLGLQGRQVSPTGIQDLVPYPLTRSSKTLSQAIDEAGGLKFEARRRILILRESEEIRKHYIVVDYRNVVKDARNDVPLQTRDTVIVKYHPTRFVFGSIVRMIQQVVRIGVSATYDLNQDDGRSGTSGGGNVVFIE